MAFIKHGDGKILNVIDEDELSLQQKKAIDDFSQDIEQDENANIQSIKTKKIGK